MFLSVSMPAQATRVQCVISHLSDDPIQEKPSSKIPKKFQAEAADKLKVDEGAKFVNYEYMKRIRGLNFDVPKGAKLYTLGAGDDNVVYRVVPPSGKPYLLRIYNEENVDDASTYVQYLKTLHELDAATSKTGFKIVAANPVKGAPRIVQQKDVRGVDLFTLLNDQPPYDAHPLSPEFKGYLRKIYDLRAQAMINAGKAKGWKFERAYEVGEVENIWYFWLKDPHSKNSDTINIGFAPRNVVVDPETLEMTLTNPVL